MPNTHPKRSMADWLAIRVWTLLPKCRRARIRTASTTELAQPPMARTTRPTVATICADTVGLAEDHEDVGSATVELTIA